MDSDQEIVPVVVFDGNYWEAALVKSLLENAEIYAFLKDEHRSVLAPWQVTPGAAGAVKVMVSSEDLEQARIVVEDFEKAEKENPTDDEL
jgi:hypothetical protein